jgi:hypothetical protein
MRNIRRKNQNVRATRKSHPKAGDVFNGINKTNGAEPERLGDNNVQPMEVGWVDGMLTVVFNVLEMLRWAVVYSLGGLGEIFGSRLRHVVHSSTATCQCKPENLNCMYLSPRLRSSYLPSFRLAHPPTTLG